MRCTKYMRKTASRFLTIHSFGQCPWNLSVRCWSFCFCTRGEGCRGPWQGCGRWLDSFCRSDRFMGYSSLASALLGPEARGCLIASIVQGGSGSRRLQSALSSLRRHGRGTRGTWSRSCLASLVPYCSLARSTSIPACKDPLRVGCPGSWDACRFRSILSSSPY